MARYFVTLSTQTKYLAARIKRKVNKYTKHAKSNVKKKLYNRQIVGRANTSGFNLTTYTGCLDIPMCVDSAQSTVMKSPPCTSAFSCPLRRSSSVDGTR